ncbi:MAG: metallophosphoesterase, partial [Phycisphaerales bacterium]|nr:metallophosphoesterase [Phycisphaerales bacterium]
MNWVIGDIHGMLRPLRALVDLVRRDDPVARFFFVGDYVNRGPDARGVLDFLLALDGARFARGNHDDIFDLLVNGRNYVANPSAPDAVAAFAWFVRYGLADTLHSYGVEPWEVEQAAAHPTHDAVARLFAPVPAAHRAFVRNLEPVIETPDFFVAHALWDADEPDADPPIADRLAADGRLRYQIVWGRYGREVLRPKRWTRTGYFGHTPVQTYPADVRGGPDADDGVPIRGPNIVLLDTAAALTPDGRRIALGTIDGKISLFALPDPAAVPA